MDGDAAEGTDALWEMGPELVSTWTKHEVFWREEKDVSPEAPRRLLADKETRFYISEAPLTPGAGTMTSSCHTGREGSFSLVHLMWPGVK